MDEIKYKSITRILDSGTKKEKISILQTLANVTEYSIIEKIISNLDDVDIEVRGEAFSCLVSNNKDISKILIKSLDSSNKYIRGFCALILANRNEIDGISEISKLTEDPSAMVRSCAVGSLGFLKAKDASKIIHKCLGDSELEVKKSALKAIVDINDKLSLEENKKIIELKDEEMNRILKLLSEK